MIELTDDLNHLEKDHQRRSLRVVEQTESGRITIAGKSVLNFSSNNYLGLARHPEVLESVRQVLEHWGVGATSSRLISGHTLIHQDLERALAAFLKTESALLFSTGYMANVGVLTSLAGQGDAIVLDRLCHASLIDGARLSGARLFVYQHGDLADAERVLKRTAAYRRRLLVTESLFSMDGDFAPVSGLAELVRHYEAIGILDEAHALGVWGDGGRGLRGVQPSSDWDVVVGTLSKSFGSQGGFVCGSSALIETLVNKARSFIYTTGLSPACVAAAQAALSLIQDHDIARTHLHALSRWLREGLARQGFDILKSESHIVPVLLGESDRALACAEHLLGEGIFAPAIRPPTVHAGQSRIRFSMTSEHTEQDVDQLLNALASWKKAGSL